MNRIAFTLPDVGLREIQGMAYIEDGFLVLNVQDAFLGMLDARKEIVKIEPGALSDVRIKYGLFRDRLQLKPRRAELLDALPGEHVASVDLRVARKHRAELEALVAEFHALA